MAALTVERGKYEAYYGAQRPGEAGETDGSRSECVLIRDWIERLLPTLSEQGWKLLNETREQIQ